MIRKLFEKLGLHSILGRLTGIAFFFIIVTAVSMGIAGFQLTINYETRQFREHFSLLASYLARNAELGVLIGNETLLEELSANMLEVSDVRVVEVFDRQGDLIIRRSERLPDEDLETVSAPVVGSSMTPLDAPFLGEAAGEELLGKVVIAYSLSGLDHLKRMLAIRFLVIAFLLALVAVAMYWMFSRAINAPLLGLLGVAGEVSRGRMDVRAPSSSLREVNTLAEAINDMLDGLEKQRQELNIAHAAMARQQVLAEVGKFSMTVAHEIKNPLAIIKGSLGILRKDGPVDPELKRRMMGFVDEEIGRINKLIEDFLLFARPRPPAFQPLLLGELVENLIHRVHLMDSNIELVIEVPAERETTVIRCDPSLLERALLNVVRNALEVSPPEHPLRVRVGWQNEQLLLTVCDRGPGIDPEQLEEIFEPFVSSKSKGTGLGLAIARDVVAAHGGTISAANRSAGGATFTLALPVADAGGVALPDQGPERSEQIAATKQGSA